MKELTEGTPKPMIRVFGKPLLEHKIDMLPDEIDEVILVVGYLGPQIREHFGEEWKGRKMKYVDQTELNGTWGAVSQAKHLLNEKFLVTMGDDLYGKEDIATLMKSEHGVLAKHSGEPTLAAMLRANETGHLTEITEKPASPEIGLINTGAYLLTPKFFSYEPIPVNETEFGLPQTMAVMAKDHPIKIHLADAWLQVSRPEDIPKAEEFLRERGISE